SINRSQTAPQIDQLTNPIVTAPNTPFFDFTSGSSVLVTAISGGNPTLGAERRQVVTTGVSITPIRGRDLRVGVDYVATRSDNQAINLGGLT
ncbi:hypothetical protein NQU49_25725, partial [Escherichia coli]|uniref:hypothetical protein n=1 Tax=Escherichia coli TaxID=562 RepID=UPI0021195721